MIRRLQADYIFTPEGRLEEGLQLIIGNEGDVINLSELEHPDYLQIEPEYYTGILCPGFINTHCHLELSHLRGVIPPGNGMLEFIRGVMKTRGIATPEERSSAMQLADREMRMNGIVAVGDISNTPESADIKRGSDILYHTFIEILGLCPDQANEKINKVLEFASRFDNWSLCAHAPYTGSGNLFERISDFNLNSKLPSTVHMHESRGEFDFYLKKNGIFTELYQDLGVDISCFDPEGSTPLQYFLGHYKPGSPLQLVHNTYSGRNDIDDALHKAHNLYWCLCPKANIYIEGKLPDIPMFMQKGLKVTVGTDSLASNNKLCVFDELLQVQKIFPECSFEMMLRWATINGAEFLGLKDKGKFEPGYFPGVNRIENIDKVGEGKPKLTKLL